jgi:hypothetical protein
LLHFLLVLNAAFSTIYISDLAQKVLMTFTDPNAPKSRGGGGSGEAVK